MEVTRIHTITVHELQVGENDVWAPAQAGMYEPARTAAELGNLTKAIKLATAIRIENYGQSDSVGIQFRVVSTVITELK